VHTELGVAQPLWMHRLVFEMQQLQRDVLAAFALTVDLEPLWLWPTRSEFFFGPSEQPRLDRCVVQFVRQRPAQTGPLRTFQVALDR
jgi:hypothetical protein